ncbi:CPBP family intramembrane glutamic endopeptidase [Peptococcus simiae]|uniref:CPBP family intramembrane glutamic endopeptidase n=1 Tax=Peptococcus simiae TaxID=1643805 RepID=UPI00397F2177
MIIKNAPDRLGRYLVLTFAISWLAWWGEALVVKISPLTAQDPPALLAFFLGGFGPTIAACLCLPGGFSLKGLGQFLTSHRPKTLPVLAAFAGLLALFFLAFSTGLVSGIPRDGRALVVFGLVFIQASLLFGGNEELGWRGTLQPLLANRLPAWLVPLVIGLIWVGWHIPLWFIEGNSHQTMSFTDFALLGLALSYWLSALMTLTRSIPGCMVLHGLTNTFLGLLVMNQGPAYYLSLAVLTGLSLAVSAQVQPRSRQRD